MLYYIYYILNIIYYLSFNVCCIIYIILYIRYWYYIFYKIFLYIIDICVEGFVELASTCLLLLFLPNLFSEYHFCRIGFWICSHLAKIGTNPRSDNAVVICFDVCIPFSIIYSILENIGQVPIMEVLLYNNFLLQ